MLAFAVAATPRLSPVPLLNKWVRQVRSGTSLQVTELVTARSGEEDLGILRLPTADGFRLLGRAISGSGSASFLADGTGLAAVARSATQTRVDINNQEMSAMAIRRRASSWCTDHPFRRDGSPIHRNGRQPATRTTEIGVSLCD